MRRILIAAGAVVVLSVASQARAVWVDQTAHYIKHGYHVNTMWPWPYVCPDRIAVREPFCAMVNNGWRRQNLLGAHHFNPETNQLTTAGELRVRWIMTQAPPDRRNIFIERSVDSSVTATRMAAARDYASQVSIDGRPPQVTETYLMAEGRPAAVVDATNLKFQESTPPPVLPAVTATNSGQ
jgi:hypothetical protein